MHVPNTRSDLDGSRPSWDHPSAFWRSGCSKHLCCMAHTSRHTASTPGDTRNSQGTVFIDGEPATSVCPICKTMQSVASHRLPGCSRVTWAQNCEVVTSGRGCLDDMLDSPQLSDCQDDDEVPREALNEAQLHESTLQKLTKQAQTLGANEVTVSCVGSRKHETGQTRAQLFDCSPRVLTCAELAQWQPVDKRGSRADIESCA